MSATPNQGSSAPQQEPAAGASAAGEPAAESPAAGQLAGASPAGTLPGGALVQERGRSELNPGGLLYGTVVSAAALAIGASRGDNGKAMTETMISTLIIYWLAHVYVAIVSGRRPGVSLSRLAGHAAREESMILIGGLPAVAVVVILQLAHVSLWTTVLSDLVTVIVVLALDGLLAGLHAGTRGWLLGIEAASAALFGGLLAVLLVSLHHR